MIPIVLTFNESIIVSGTPTLYLALQSGSVVLSSVSSTVNTIMFRYTISAGQIAAVLNLANASSLIGVITDLAGNPFSTILPFDNSVNSLVFYQISVDTASLSVVNVSSTTASGSYRQGVVLDLLVIFNKPVFVAMSPTVLLTGISTLANYLSGNSTTQLIFRYEFFTKCAMFRYLPIQLFSQQCCLLSGFQIYCSSG